MRIIDASSMQKTKAKPGWLPYRRLSIALGGLALLLLLSLVLTPTLLAAPPAQATLMPGIHGMKWLDENGNGELDPGEPGIEGWEIFLVDAAGNIVRSTKTNLHGDYWFVDVPEGEYTVREESRTGWRQTYPPEKEYTNLKYVPNQPIYGLDFGNTMEGDGGIHGMKFFDKNNNGQKDDDEPGIPGWTIMLQGPNNLFMTTTTNLRGHYWFSNLPNGNLLPAGDYTVTEEQRPNWTQTLPATPNGYQIVYDPTQSINNLDFGNYMPPRNGIHGTKFLDENGNGKQDDGEPGIPAWFIILRRADGSVVARTLTDTEGRYWFVGLDDGRYIVEEEQRDLWEQTYPSSGKYEVSFVTSQNIDGLDFGNRPRRLGSIHGVKFHDENGNGHWDDGEPTLADWVIKLEGRNGIKRETKTMADGWYWFEKLPPGVYTVTEELQSGWHQSYPRAGYHLIMLESGQKEERAHFGNWKPKPGEIHGIKWEDLNGNGRRDGDEKGVSGWTIVLEGRNGFSQETTTDDQGRYWFMNLRPGEYKVSEKDRSGWYQTYPKRPAYHAVELEAGDVIDGLNFGNWRPGPGEIHGIKWNDLNGNGRHDPGEPGLKGWVIVIEGTNFSAETTTDERGRYWFMDLKPGRYKVYEKQQSGWRQTFPHNGVHYILLAPGQIVERAHFGNWQPKPGEIHGMKWNDLNSDGVKDSGEPGIEGWTIVLYGRNGFKETATTDKDGNYWFMNLRPGTYLVRERGQNGWYQTAPANGYHLIRLGLGDVKEGVDFGNTTKPGEIHGMKWHDLNGDGVKDSGEPGLANWVIRIRGRDGFSQTTTTDANGEYWFMELPRGKYVVRELLPDDWKQTYPKERVHTVELGPGEVVDGKDFGNWQPAPGSIHGMKWYDFDGDGQQDSNEPPIANWTIVLASDDGLVRQTQTMTDGHYWFQNLRPGRYIIGERMKDGWQQSFPATRVYTVELKAGETATGYDFGNWKPRPGSVHGMKWYDKNGNGQQDIGERPLAGWRIVIVGRNYRSHTVTDENGLYWFENVPPGNYRVFEIHKYRWRQTYPTTGAHIITLTPGRTLHGVNFGNRRLLDADFCKIHWDIHFPDEVSVDTKVHIFNTSAAARSYNLQLIGLPKGTNGSRADGPDTFDILDPLPFSVPGGSHDGIDIRIYYPDSFKDGDPGPALFAAIVTNTDTNETTVCRSKLWPYRDIRPFPVEDEVLELPVGDIRTVEFNVANLADFTDAAQRAANTTTVKYKIHAMTEGEEDESSIISLNDLPPGNTVEGELTIVPGLDETISVQVEFEDGQSDGTSDILLEIDEDGDGNPESVVSSSLRSTDRPVYLPIVFK